MLHCCRLLLLILTVSCFCITSLQAAEIEVELRNGQILTPDRITWGASATLILESTSTNKPTSKSIPLDQIQRLSIDGSQYDQATIQLAAANSNFIEPTAFEMIRQEQPAIVTPLPPESEPMPIPVCNLHCDRGVIIGVREDPLSAYEPQLNQIYPDGVPTLERGFALELMRSQTAQRVLGSPGPQEAFPPPPEAAPYLGKLTQIRVQATPLNTEGKADWNALAVRVQGLDQTGQPARLSGTVNIHLYGERQLLLPVWDQEFLAKPIKTIPLAQWTRNCATIAASQPLRASNMYGSGSAADQTWIVRFPSPIPAQNPNVYAFGTVQVSLASPGKGTFSAAVAAVPLKQTSIDRDLSLVNEGTRFFPSETTSSSVYRLKRLNYNAASRPGSRTLAIQP